MKLHRRELLLGSAALAASAPALARRKPRAAPALPQDGYYLSATNPVANRDQRELEALAIRLQARGDMQAAITQTAASWARVTSNTVSKQTWTMFDANIADYCFRSTLLGVNSDANYPKVLRVYSPSGKWFGMDVPASKWGAENPDNCYRIIPIGSGGRYVVRGQRMANPSSHCSFVLVADTDTSITVGLIDQRDLEIAADGSFVITLDETPVNGRKNHIQVTPDAQYLFVRDSMGDWMQTPNALRVERLNPPSRAPLTEDELAWKAARVMRTGVAPAYYWIHLILNTPVNTLSHPELTGAAGGLLTQLSCGGHFELADDEAFVITTDPVDCAYFSIVFYDLWNRSLEYRDHQTSLNNATMAPDAGGRFTFVIARTDPGVQNWVETTGLNEFSGSFRWQGIGKVEKVPAIETKLVKLSGLAAALPADVRKVTPAERARQLALRQKLFDRRFADI